MIKKLIKAIHSANGINFNNTLKKIGNYEGLSFEGETFTGLHLVGFDFRALNFSNTEWENCMLDNIICDLADFNGAYLNGTTVLNSSFKETNFEGTAFEACIIKRCIFQDINLNRSECSDTEFGDCEFKNLCLDEIEWENVTFNGGKLANLKGSEGNISSWIMRAPHITDFDTSDLSVTRCTISGLLEGSQVPKGFSVRSGRRKKI